jgi:endonuclease YncB( thermonuclease family)
MSIKPRAVEATVNRVLGPDMFEADVDLEFDIRTIRRLKLAGVDSNHLRSLEPDALEEATKFLRNRIEGRTVMLRPIRKGEHYYARVCYGPEERDVLEEMITHGLLRRFERSLNGSEV